MPIRIPDWETFLRKSRPELDLSTLGCVLCLDPGETTGYAIFMEGLLYECGQQVTGQNPELMAEFIQWVNGHLPVDQIVYEEYRIRGNKAQQHVGSEVVTIQHIGAIKVVAGMLDIPIYKQTAGMAKGFATDERLRHWGLWQPNHRHANDAIRHGTYWHLFVAGRRRR